MPQPIISLLEWIFFALLTASGSCEEQKEDWS